MSVMKPWHIIILLLLLVAVVLPLVVIIGVVLAAAKKSSTPAVAPMSGTQPSWSAPAESSPHEILDRRLASGEITEEEHRRLREALGPDRR